eukprot:6208221-Pleurochrysis_carterae.AAC.2
MDCRHRKQQAVEKAGVVNTIIVRAKFKVTNATRAGRGGRSSAVSCICNASFAVGFEMRSASAPATSTAKQPNLNPVSELISRSDTRSH